MRRRNSGPMAELSGFGAIRAALLIGLAGLPAGCSGPAQGEIVTGEEIRIHIGMAVDEFNKQPSLNRSGKVMDPERVSVIRLDVPHRIALEINEETVRIEGGGVNSFTIFDNMFSVDDGEGDYSRIGSVSFNLGGGLLLVEDAVHIASELCQDIRRTGLATRTSVTASFARVAESDGSGSGLSLNAPSDIIAAFSDEKLGVKGVELCFLEDNDLYFNIDITYSQFARGSRAYRVRGYISQNTGSIWSQSS